MSMAGFKNSCNEMYEEILRIRILANSNSEEDQTLKLIVRDAVLEASKDIYSNAENIDDAIAVTNANLQKLQSAAQTAVQENGYDYSVSIRFKDEYFDTRVYEDFTLPAGVYKTAVFNIGEGKGKNWWCVIYPRVCVGACSDGLQNSLSDSSCEIVYSPEKYEVKFKTIEIFENIKKYLDFEK